jgi:hypothetical protein
VSRFIDERTSASDPGAVVLSDARLAEIEPALFTTRTFKCGPTCSIDHPASEIRERLREHLLRGDSRAAVVVSVSPLVVAAFSDDLDAVALLSFPPELAERYGLSVGSRLLTVNLYVNVPAAHGDERLYAVDLVPGPARSGWSNFMPLIADFVSDDRDRIESRKRGISEEEWSRAERLTQTRIAALGLETARDGRPSAIGMPVRIAGLPYFVTSRREPAAFTSQSPSGNARAPVALVVLALLLMFALWLMAQGR